MFAKTDLTVDRGRATSSLNKVNLFLKSGIICREITLESPPAGFAKCAIVGGNAECRGFWLWTQQPVQPNQPYRGNIVFRALNMKFTPYADDLETTATHAQVGGNCSGTSESGGH